MVRRVPEKIFSSKCPLYFSGAAAPASNLGVKMVIFSIILAPKMAIFTPKFGAGAAAPEKSSGHFELKIFSETSLTMLFDILKI